jgi:hypothetical protein
LSVATAAAPDLRLPAAPKLQGCCHAALQRHADESSERFAAAVRRTAQARLQPDLVLPECLNKLQCSHTSHASQPGCSRLHTVSTMLHRRWQRACPPAPPACCSNCCMVLVHVARPCCTKAYKSLCTEVDAHIRHVVQIQALPTLDIPLRVYEDARVAMSLAHLYRL